MTEVWSCGGGTQSAAIAALIVKGILPKPDIAVIADTGRERSSTWAYYSGVLKPALSSVDVDLMRIHKDVYATVDLWGGSDGSDLLIPAFTDKEGAGKLPTYCSNEWKRRVIMRWLKHRKVVKAHNWIGFSLDELDRVRTGPPAWFQSYYPLIFGPKPLRRAGCVQECLSLGWPLPPRSSCWMCPNHSNEEWKEIKASEDWAKVIAFDAEIRLKDSHVFLHKDLKPIDQCQFISPSDADDSCQTGFCFV